MSTSLVQLTNERIGDNMQLQAFINKARSVANVIFPESLPFDNNNHFKLGCEVISADINNKKHVYKTKNGGWSFHLSKLKEIANAAKIRISDSRILEKRVDDEGKPVFIEHQVKIRYLTVYGDEIEEVYTGTYDYDLDIATKGSSEALTRRVHCYALAESKAVARAINKVLPQLQMNLTEESLKKPFLIPYPILDKESLLSEFSPEERNEIKKELARKRLGISAQIYNTPQQIAAPTPVNEPINEVKAEPIENANFEDIPNIQSPDLNENFAKAETFRDAPQKERTTLILKLIKEKSYKHPKGAVMTATLIERAPLDRQITFIEELLNMPEEISL